MGELVRQADGTTVYLKHWPGVYYDEKYEIWRFACAVKECYLSVGCATEAIANDFKLMHTCPKPNGYTRIGWSVYGPSLLEQTWAELDAVTERLLNPSIIPEEHDVGYARGLAFTLSLFMMPHFRTPKDVAREARKRWQMKQAGEEYVSPGLASRRYEAPPDNHKLDVRSGGVPVKSKSKGKQLSDVELAAIKNAAAMFPHEELAKVYGITVERVKEIVG